MKKELKEKIKPIVNEIGFNLEEVELGKRNDENAVKVVISGEGLGVDDCGEVSREIEDIVERANPFGEESFVLVVTSPGS